MEFLPLYVFLVVNEFEEKFNKRKHRNKIKLLSEIALRRFLTKNQFLLKQIVPSERTDFANAKFQVEVGFLHRNTDFKGKRLVPG